jgi:hypothetical protein
MPDAGHFACRGIGDQNQRIIVVSLKIGVGARHIRMKIEGEY